MALAMALLVSLAYGLHAGEPFDLPSFDGFELTTVVDKDDGATKLVVILLHGSGPQNYDQNLSKASAPGVKNLFFKDLSAALVERGFTVLRYNKRSYQVSKLPKAERTRKQRRLIAAYSKDPLRYFVEDAKHYVRYALERFPRARVYLLGHSQGTFVALQAANEEPGVSGLGLIGFMGGTLDTAVFEQTVYRPLSIFRMLDGDNDGVLGPEELQADLALARNLRAQISVVDTDADGSLSRSEFMGANYSNMLMDTGSLSAYRRREAAYPRPVEILEGLDLPVAFFHGEWDNQVPAYNLRAVQVLERTTWKKKGWEYHYIPRSGHALDPRKSYDDLLYKKTDPATLKKVAGVLDRLWEPVSP